MKPKLSGKTQVYAIVGDPVSHSLSPALQNAWIQAAGLDAVYVPLAIAERGADRGFAGLTALGLKGANVTLPHKERAARAANRLDVAAEMLCAANVLRWEPDGRVSAFNTDAPGLVAALDEAHPDWRGAAETALVIGGGGAARAAVWGLAKAGVSRVLVCNRTATTGEAAAALVEGGAAIAWDEIALAFSRADLIVNTTSLGMRGMPPMLWPIEEAKPTAIVMDTVYAPRETQLLKNARARGLKTVEGLGMLLHQGALSFALWFDQKPDIALGRAALEQALSESGG
jgi:shikimate dehydrogenase